VKFQHINPPRRIDVLIRLGRISHFYFLTVCRGWTIFALSLIC
jgi:hypothetical protein